MQILNYFLSLLLPPVPSDSSCVSNGTACQVNNIQQFIFWLRQELKEWQSLLVCHCDKLSRALNLHLPSSWLKYIQAVILVKVIILYWI